MEDDKELEEILKKKKEKLLKSVIKKSDRSLEESSIDKISLVKSYMNPDAWNYLISKVRSDKSSFDKIIDAIYFLISMGLVEKPISREAVVYITRRVLGEDYKIYIQEEGELKEI